MRTEALKTAEEVRNALAQATRVAECYFVPEGCAPLMSRSLSEIYNALRDVLHAAGQLARQLQEIETYERKREEVGE